MLGGKPKTIRWAVNAQRDLAEIGEHLFDTESIDASSRILNRIIAVSKTLRKNASVWRIRDELFSGARLVRAHPYAIIYQIDGTIVYIVRVVHARRDLEAIFKDERTI